MQLLPWGFGYEYEIEYEKDISFNSTFQALVHQITYPFHPMSYPVYLKTIITSNVKRHWFENRKCYTFNEMLYIHMRKPTLNSIRAKVFV